MKKSKLAINKGSSLKNIMFILALICMLGLIWFAYHSHQSNKKISSITGDITQQVGISGRFYPEYLKSVYGDSAAVERLNTDMAEFEQLLAKIDSGDAAALLSDSQEATIGAIKPAWQRLKGKLQQYGKIKTNIENQAARGDTPNHLAIMNETSAVEKGANDLRSSLFTLRANYEPRLPKAVSMLPFTLPVALLVLTVLTIAFFALWVLLQLRSSYHLQDVTNQLVLEAENKNKNDQDAILRLMDEMAGLSEGDLTMVALVTEDFTGAVADQVNFAVENMREMVGTIIHTSDEITRATKDTQNMSRLLRDSSKTQSQQIDKANDTVSRMSKSLHEIAENTDASAEIARSSVDIAQEGRERVISTIKSMTDIRENIQDTAKRIKRLGESSQEIGDIVEIIKSIADQTNVLALNAAIQATTAGEAGRGFAVVADEVQQLAERSANATKRIEVLVKTIQADANEAIASMESSTTQVVSGAGIAEEAGQSLDKIENVSQNLANLIINVSQATRNAAGMAGRVAQGMDKLSELNQDAVSDVTKSVQSIDNLGELSVSLKDSVSGFKLPDNL